MPTGPARAEDDGFIDVYGAQYTASRAEKDAKPDLLDAYPLFAVVSIADQHISIYGSGGLLARSSVSTGKRGHSTPTGVFSIVQKQRFHRSNLYSDAPMPFMQRITWSGIALHAGVVPGHPASHGCIRLPPSFAQRLFSATSVGQRVIVAPSDTAPVEITHANLPAPFLSPVPEGVTAMGASAAQDEIVSIDIPARRGGAVLEPVSLQTEPPKEVRLNPIEFARAMKSKASRDAKAAGQATRAAIRIVASKNAELRKAMRKFEAADDEAKAAARKVASLVRQLEDPDGKEVIAEADWEKVEADAALVQALQRRQARIATAAEARIARREGARRASEGRRRRARRRGSGCFRRRR